MKKLKIVFFALSFLFITNVTMAQGIKWFEGSFEEAKALAKKENKQIFFYVYTTW